MDNVERIKKTKSGIKWSMLGQGVSQGANILFAILLTRLLNPNIFGLIGMVLVFSGLLQVLRDFGISNALIYKKNITAKDLDTAFWGQTIFGTFLTFTLILSGKYIASFYGEPKIEPIVFCISFTFAIDSLGYVHAAFLRKNLLFKRLFIINTISVVLSGIIALTMAMNSYGIWSLVAKILALSITQTTLLWIAVNWKPSLQFSKVILYEQLRYGIPLVGNKIVVYLMRNSDSILIGKFIGADALGIYNRAYSLMMMPINQLVSIYGGVMFPSLCLVSDNKEVFKNNWIKITRIASFLTLPITSLIFLISEDVVPIVLGHQWLGVIPILKYLSFAAAIQAICTVGYVFNAKGKTKELFIMNLSINATLLFAIILGIPYGIESVALFYAIASIVFIPLPVWFFTSRLVGCSLLDILGGIAKIFIVNGCVLIIFMIIKNNIDIPAIYNIFIIPAGYILAYLAFLFLLKEKIFSELYILVVRN